MSDFIPSSDLGKKNLFTNVDSKLSTYSTKYGFTAGELTDYHNARLTVDFIFASLTGNRNLAKALTEIKNIAFGIAIGTRRTAFVDA